MPGTLPCLTESRQKAKAKLQGRIRKGKEIEALPLDTEERYRAAERRFDTWNSYNNTLLKRLFSTDDVAANYRRGLGSAVVLGAKPLWQQHAEHFPFKVGVHRSRLESIRNELELYDEPGPAAGSGMTVQTGTATGVGSQQRVFIIHGRNKSPARKLKELLADRFNLAGVILVDMGGSSLTIIEKFEDEASLCRYAFAVFTPDDFVQARDGEQYYQMRPNVLFELGWCFAFAKMGRSRTCILCKKGTNIPSDLRGIFFLEFTRSITQIEDGIRIELEKAGLAVTSPEDPDVEPGH